MYNKYHFFRTQKFIYGVLLLGIALFTLSMNNLSIAYAQDKESEFSIITGTYQIPQELLEELKSNLDSIDELSGNATVYGVGYYEEHPHWSWINLSTADGDYFNPNEIGRIFVFFCVKDNGQWKVVFSENNEEYIALLDSISRDELTIYETKLLDEYYYLNQGNPASGVSALAGNLLFPWPNTQNPWKVGSLGIHDSGFGWKGEETGAKAIDLLPQISSSQSARVIAMESGYIITKYECTWNTLLILRHDGYPDSKTFTYMHLQNGTSPVEQSTTVSQGQYLGDLHDPVPNYNGYWSNGKCTTSGTGPFNCERDPNPGGSGDCSWSDTRHIHLGIGTATNISIDGNVVANLNIGNNYNSTNQENSDGGLINDEFNNPILHPHWHWYREVPTHWSLTASQGFLRINTQPKDIYELSNNAPLLLQSLQPFSSDDFEIQTRIIIEPTSNFHQGGLVFYDDDDNYVRFTYAYINGPTFEFAKEIDGNFQPIQISAPPGINDFHLRIVKSGLNYSAYYSQDENNWIWIGTHLNVNISPLEVGLLAFNAVDVTSIEIPADFDYFRATTDIASTTFVDVPTTFWAWDYIERFYSAGITGGCSTNPLTYCPNNSVTRAQMAVFLEKGIHGSSFSPPDVAPTFNDTAGTWAEDWIEALKNDGITGGCGGGNYCPNNPVTRAQMAVFLLKSKYGSGYTPPDVGGSTGFNDIPVTHWAAPWIKQLAAEGITSGCGGGNYCPNNSVTRAQMAVFLVKTFNLP